MFKPEYATLDFIRSIKPSPDFNNLVKVLKRQEPSRTTLYEFFLNHIIVQMMTEGEEFPKEYEYDLKTVSTFRKLGYDYVTLGGSDFNFKKTDLHRKSSVSLNEGALITDFESFEKYEWNEAENYSYDKLEKIILPEGMKMIIGAPNGTLENVINLMGYDNLCYAVIDEPELVELVFENVGKRLLKYYEICLEYDNVGAVIVNDDWGFNTQTVLSTDDMRKYPMKWHKKIAEAARKHNKPVFMHSCGQLKEVYDDLAKIYDAKHSYEDNILPVEMAYDLLHDKMAVLGGMDLDFVCRKSHEEIFNRARNMVLKAKSGYALGTGNSVPEFVPTDNYFAMISAVLVDRI